MRILALLVLLLAGSTAARAETNACTVIDSIPITISSPGSYCLHSDLTSSVVVDDVNMIHIAQTSDVTLDCNGHHLSGVSHLQQDLEAIDYYGIKVGSSTRVTVRNCNVHGFRNGIIVHRYADGFERSRDIVLENNMVERANYAIYMSSEGTSRVTGNLVRETMRRGIEVYAAPGQTIVSGNTVSTTGFSGIDGEAGVFSQLGGWLIVENNTFSDTLLPTSAPAAAVRIDTFSGTGLLFSGNRITKAHGLDVTGDSGLSNPGAFTCLSNVFAGFGPALPVNCTSVTNLAF
jgi:parallel beta-helix repeat protein